jgi:hypothetical protein
MEDRKMLCGHKYGETTNASNYDGSCTLRHFQSGIYKISGHFILVSQSIPIYKKGDKTHCSNYLSIAHLSTT